MGLRKSMLITDIFFCENLNGTLAYKTCLLRQISKRYMGNDGFVLLYVECRDCARGLAVKQEFKDVKIEIKDKRTRPINTAYMSSKAKERVIKERPRKLSHEAIVILKKLEEEGKDVEVARRLGWKV